MITITSPQGIAPRLNPRALQDTQAQVAQNCVLDLGDCRPLKAPVQSTSLDASTKSVLSMESWKEFDNYASAITSPVTGNDRYYWTDESGGGHKAEGTGNAKDLGVPQPGAGPSTTKGGSQDSDEPIRSSTYVYTRVTDWGEESAPSQPSGIMDIYDGEHVEFSGMDDGGSSHVTHFRLYRAAGGESDSVYLAVPYQKNPGAVEYDEDNNIVYDIPKDELDDMQDGLRDVDLRVQLETDDWLEPPGDLKGLTDLGNGTMMAYSGQEVLFSALWAPYAWPMAYRYTLDHGVVGVGHIAGVPVAFTAYSTYLFDGSTPDSYQQRKISETQGCASSLSIVNTLQGVVFASRDGLCMAGTDGVQGLSLPVWTREQWNRMDLGSLVGTHFNERYYGFFKGGNAGFIFPLNQQEQSVTEFELSQTIVNAYMDSDNEKLYVILQDGSDVDLYEFDAGDNLQSTWRSKVFRVPPVNLSSLKIVGESGDSKIKFIVDGEEKHSVTATHGQAYRLPAGYKGRELEVEIKSSKTWFALGITGSMEELRDV